jgi:hypothetical protein
VRLTRLGRIGEADLVRVEFHARENGLRVDGRRQREQCENEYAANNETTVQSRAEHGHLQAAHRC